jgi:hypothetical protein
MSYQNVSYVMPQADIDAVKTAIATINSKMPFLISLTEEERKTLLKMGPKSVDFVQDSFTTTQNFPAIIPVSFNVAEYTKDATLLKILVDLQASIDSLADKVDDTLMAVGSEAMGASLDVYTYVQTSADKTPGLRSVADRLRARFKGQGRKKISPAPDNIS